MSEPEIFAKTPAVLEMDAGTYYWCACGKSKKQPWCDGSHSGSEFSPVKVEITEKKRVAMCNCKHSANKPFCDGAHKNL